MNIEAPHSEPGQIRRATTALCDAVSNPPPWREPTAVLSALQRLVASPEPSVVLASLTDVCAPTMADECWGTILEAGVARPLSMAAPLDAGQPSTPATWTMPLAGGDQFTLSFAQNAWEQYPEFSGTMSWRWQDRDRPTRSDKVIAQLLLDRAIDVVRTQRLEAAVAFERDKAANLQVALVSNREIAQAIGILMSAHKLTSQQGFDLLRTASQHTHRKLRDVAAEVCDTGMLELPASR